MKYLYIFNLLYFSSILFVLLFFKVRELQWNQEQKLKGLPTSDEIRNMEILKRAWNADGSPFKGKEFDPSVLQIN